MHLYIILKVITKLIQQIINPRWFSDTSVGMNLSKKIFRPQTIQEVALAALEPVVQSVLNMPLDRTVPEGQPISTAALSQLAGNVNQKRQPNRKKKGYTLKQIAAIAEDANSGKIKLRTFRDYDQGESENKLGEIIKHPGQTTQGPDDNSVVRDKL